MPQSHSPLPKRRTWYLLDLPNRERVAPQGQVRNRTDCPHTQSSDAMGRTHVYTHIRTEPRRNETQAAAYRPVDVELAEIIQIKSLCHNSVCGKYWSVTQV